MGIPVPEEMQDVWSLNIVTILSSLFNYLKWFNVTQLGQILGINPSLMRQYKSGKTYISRQQMKPSIERGFTNLGTKLLELNRLKNLEFQKIFVPL